MGFCFEGRHELAGLYKMDFGEAYNVHRLGAERR